MLITANELNALLQGGADGTRGSGSDAVRVVDARSPRRYAQGHIPGAVNLPLSAIVSLEGTAQALAGPDAFAEVAGKAGIDHGIQVVVYGERAGVEASYVAWALEYYGHPAVRFLDGGVEAWTAQGFSLETEPAHVAPRTFRPEPNEALRATAEEISSRLGQDGVQFVDTRDVPEFTGEIALAKRGGHIPGAIRFDWRETVRPDTTFKPFDEVAAILRESGIDAASEKVLYCMSGPRATHLYVIMKAIGYGPAKIYERSWSEWGNRDDLPVATGMEES